MLDQRADTFYIIDGYGFIFRAFYALPKLTTSKGEHIGAVYGFFKMLITLINSAKPTHLVIALDTGHRTFRNDIYDKFVEEQSIKTIYQEHKMEFDIAGIKLNDLLQMSSQDLIGLMQIDIEKCKSLCQSHNIEFEKLPKMFVIAVFLGIEDTIQVEDYKTQYKANRKETPEELKSQFKIIKEFIEATGIKSEFVYGFEADDVICSLAKNAVKQGKQVVIVSGDKDLCQIVKDGEIEVYDPVKKKHLDEQGVLEKNCSVQAKNFCPEHFSDQNAGLCELRKGVRHDRNVDISLISGRQAQRQVQRPVRFGNVRDGDLRLDVELLHAFFGLFLDEDLLL